MMGSKYPSFVLGKSARKLLQASTNENLERVIGRIARGLRGDKCGGKRMAPVEDRLRKLRKSKSWGP